MRNLFRAVSDRVRAARDPIGFARSLCVDVADDVRFYGISRGMFGSEPWMIRIHEKVFITAGVAFVTHDGGFLVLRDEVPTLEWSAPIEIQRRVCIRIRSILLPGVTSGERRIVGAGSVVTKNIPPNSVVAGVPAKPICDMDEYLRKFEAKSLGFGNLSAVEKDAALRIHYEQKGWFQGADSHNRP